MLFAFARNFASVLNLIKFIFKIYNFLLFKMNHCLKKIKKKQKVDYLNFVRPEKSIETKKKLHEIKNVI